ncbi:MAG TPA: hypothetical protein PLQ76_00300 [bacterium]|nr:hypothetical protein [bacterium]
MAKHAIYGIHITNRMKNAPAVQKLFSEYGCYIKTRIGLHDVNENFCAPAGAVILEMYGDEKKYKQLAEKLAKVKGIEVKKMIFKA